jgi:histone H3
MTQVKKIACKSNSSKVPCKKLATKVAGKAATLLGGVKKPHHYCPGTVTLQESIALKKALVFLFARCRSSIF